MEHNQIISLLGEEGQWLLDHVCKARPQSQLNLPGPDFVERVYLDSSRNIRTVSILSTLFKSGVLGGAGYLSILPAGDCGGRKAGLKLKSLPTDIAYTSVLKRAKHTLEIILKVINAPAIPAISSKNLDERCYGELEGLIKQKQF